ncbi:ribosome silencing factor [Bacteroidota bacterium]
MTENKKNELPETLNAIIEALQEKKGNEILYIDLKKVGNAVCDYFVICHGNSTTQVDSLSDAVLQNLKKELNVSAHHVEGKNNSFWVLMDYSDILVHIFLDEHRKFYNLEDLWADGELVKIENE